MEFHEPVLVPEVEHFWINNRPGIYVDATLGGGGYVHEIAPRYLDQIKIIGIDQDGDALSFAKSRLQQMGDKIIYYHANFRHLGDILNKLGIDVVDGILIDLGVSSYQLDTPTRGFSYRVEAPLDLRMDRSRGMTAQELVATSEEGTLADMFWRYGEERYSRQIAKAIVKARKKSPINTTTDLADIIRSAIPTPKSVKALSRCFQAIRYKLNEELESLSEVLEQIPSLLSSGGRAVIIAYESLSDRLVKKFFIREQKGCICPPSFPKCVCGRTSTLKILTKHPVMPTAGEVLRNSRAAGAKLRSCERL